MSERPNIMIHRFKKNTVYGGETLFGGCGCLERNKITILKRTKGWIVYKQQFIDKIFKTKRDYVSGWGDCIVVPNDEYHAYCTEPEVEPF